MTIDAFKELFERDLNRLKIDIEAYKNYDDMWKTTGGIKNSAGHLSVHIVGNLNYYMGAGLSNNGYVRNIDLEFSCQSIPKAELIKQIDDAIAIVIKALDQLTEDQLKEDFPIQIWENKVSTIFFLMHLHSHLNYHLGQINYHRRLLDKSF